METQPLRVASQPVPVDGLLDSFVVSQRYVPSTARRIHSRDELPLRLQRCTRNVRNSIWHAWSDGLRIWFVLGTVVPEISREQRRHALHVSFFDMEGRLASSGVWTLSGDGRWVLYDACP
jgi:hypothetical protein